MKILITGVHGFVGSNLVEALKKEHTIYGLDIINPSMDGVAHTFSWDEVHGSWTSQAQYSRLRMERTGCDV